MVNDAEQQKGWLNVEPGRSSTAKRALPTERSAEETDVSVRTAFQDVQAVLSEVAAFRQDTAEEYVELELERLDAGIRALSDAATAGNIRAIEAQRKHGESRRKLLGLDAVGKHEHSGPGGQSIPVITEIRRVIVYPEGKEP